MEKYSSQPQQVAGIGGDSCTPDHDSDCSGENPFLDLNITKSKKESTSTADLTVTDGPNKNTMSRQNDNPEISNLNMQNKVATNYAAECTDAVAMKGILFDETLSSNELSSKKEEFAPVPNPCDALPSQEEAQGTAGSLSDRSTASTSKSSKNILTLHNEEQEEQKNLLLKKSSDEILKHVPKEESASEMSHDKLDDTGSSPDILSKKTAVKQKPKSQDPRLNLLRLQHQRCNSGIWVQCVSCNKWRYLKSVSDPQSIHPEWKCSMNSDTKFSSCSVEEVGPTPEEEEDMVHSLYSAGSLVWAHMAGFPWWPAMVDDDPDYEQFYWLNDYSDIPTYYNVVFFDSEPVTRAWICPNSMLPYKGKAEDKHMCKSTECNKNLKNRFQVAVRDADRALSLNISQRLQEFSFVARYLGKVGKKRKKTKHLQPEPKKQKKHHRKHSKKQVSDDDSVCSEESFELRKAQMLSLSELHSKSKLGPRCSKQENLPANSESSLQSNTDDSSDNYADPSPGSSLKDSCSSEQEESSSADDSSTATSTSTEFKTLKKNKKKIVACNKIKNSNSNIQKKKGNNTCKEPTDIKKAVKCTKRTKEQTCFKSLHTEKKKVISSKMAKLTKNQKKIPFSSSTATVLPSKEQEQIKETITTNTKKQVTCSKFSIRNFTKNTKNTGLNSKTAANDNRQNSQPKKVPRFTSLKVKKVKLAGNASSKDTIINKEKESDSPTKKQDNLISEKNKENETSVCAMKGTEGDEVLSSEKGTDSGLIVTPENNTSTVPADTKNNKIQPQTGKKRKLPHFTVPIKSKIQVTDANLHNIPSQNEDKEQTNDATSTADVFVQKVHCEEDKNCDGKKDSKIGEVTMSYPTTTEGSQLATPNQPSDVATDTGALDCSAVIDEVLTQMSEENISFFRTSSPLFDIEE